MVLVVIGLVPSSFGWTQTGSAVQYAAVKHLGRLRVQGHRPLRCSSASQGQMDPTSVPDEASTPAKSRSILVPVRDFPPECGVDHYASWGKTPCPYPACSRKELDIAFLYGPVDFRRQGKRERCGLAEDPRNARPLNRMFPSLPRGKLGYPESRASGARQKAPGCPPRLRRSALPVSGLAERYETSRRQGHL